MRTASRHMPPFVPAPMRLRHKLFGVVAALALASTLLYFVAQASMLQLAVGTLAFAALGLYVNHVMQSTRRHLEALATERSGESICAFARSFDGREVDTWVIRAVYEELQEMLQLGSQAFPVRATDNLEIDLKIDLNELDWHMSEAIPARTGRPLLNAKANPLWGKIRTASDLVMFFNAQPRLKA